MKEEREGALVRMIHFCSLCVGDSVLFCYKYKLCEACYLLRENIEVLVT